MWRRTAFLWQPHGTTLRGASDSLRQTRPAAQALRYSAGPTMKHNAAMLLRLFFDLLRFVQVVRWKFMDLRSLPGLTGLLKRTPAGMNGFASLLPSSTDGALAAEGRTAQADGGTESR